MFESLIIKFKNLLLFIDSNFDIVIISLVRHKNIQ